MDPNIFIEPVLENAAWRKKVEVLILKQIDEVKNFNSFFEGRVRPRVIDPVWNKMLRRIRDINEQVAARGMVVDTGLYKWNTKVGFQIGFCRENISI